MNAGFDAASAFLLVLLLMAPLAVAGLALINTGLSRSRSAAQSILGSAALAAWALVVFALAGSAVAGWLPPASGGWTWTLNVAGKPWNLSGMAPLLLAGAAKAPAAALGGLLFEATAAALLVLIPWGSGSDRFRLAGGLSVAVMLALVAFPLLAHWTWNGGWLGGLGANFQLGAGFLDPGGAASIHLLGGLAALAVIWITGPRRGKFPREGLATAMPGHNAVYVVFGCLLALVGWTAFNLAGTLLWVPGALKPPLALVALNTMLTAAAALMATYVVTRARFGKPDASLCANGWLAGLVASSAAAPFLPPAGALVLGAVAGVAAPLLVELLELALSIDDPSGAIAVHVSGGLLGLVAAGLAAPLAGQLTAQLVGIAAILGLLFPGLYFAFLLVNRFVPFRADPDGERMGMDLDELGGSAYPEFVIHRDESYR